MNNSLKSPQKNQSTLLKRCKSPLRGETPKRETPKRKKVEKKIQKESEKKINKKEKQPLIRKSKVIEVDRLDSSPP